MTITGRIGLIGGDPVAHSLSPVFQQAAFDALGIPVRYERWHTLPKGIPERVAAMRSGIIYGANVTVPHKETFFGLVDERTPLASRVGAVNTLLVREGRIVGDNTDVHGFVQPLREREFSFSMASALVLGAGGAARGVVVGLLDAGIREVVVANRTLARAEALCTDLDDGRLSACGLGAALAHAENTQLLVHATALGWGNEELAVDRAIFERLPAGALAYDLTYQATPFLSAAGNAGLETIDGFPMLLHQGARSFEIWTGQVAPIDIMWAAAAAARG